MFRNNKGFIFGLIAVLVVVSAIIFVPKFYSFNSENKVVKFIDFNKELPEGYIPKQQEQSKEVVVEEKQTKEVEQKISKGISFKEHLTNTPEVDEVELQKKRIIARLMKASFNDGIKLDKATDFEIIVNEEDEGSVSISPYITTTNYGKEKNRTSARVNLDRTMAKLTNIPALLINAINSSLGGPVKAMIEKNIYAIHGRNILIPKGSVAYGNYKPLKKIGDERLSILWHEARTPEGVLINLKASSADMMGRNGAIGDLDNHWFERFGLALTFSTLSNVVSYVAVGEDKSTTDNEEDTTTTTVRDDVIRDYKNDTASIVEQIVKQQKLKPTVDIAAGTRILILPIDDIWFPQPENNKINVELVNKVKSNKKGELDEEN